MHIQLQQLEKSYLSDEGSVRAVNSLDWSAESGKIYGVLGPNGSGKTSTIKMLLNLLHPDSGEVFVDGERWGNRTSRFRKQIGYLPEERGLYKKDNVLELLTYLGRLKGLTLSTAQSSAKEFLLRFDLGEYEHSPLESLSKGMSQKVQLITALIHKPQLVVLDEPFSGLDPVNVRTVRSVILDLKARGALVILCTHRMDEAERLCDEILMLRKGKIALCGTQREIRENYGAGHITLSSSVPLEDFLSIERVEHRGDLQEVFLHAEKTSQDFLTELASKNMSPPELHITPISLEELYIRAAAEV